jgi:phosphatidate cytidylyltransferase
VASGLRQRIVTALALAALVIGILFWMPPAAAVVAVAAVVLAGAWEWAGFAGFVTPLRRLGYTVGIGIAAWAAWRFTADPAGLAAFLRVTALWWILASIWIVLAAKRGGRLAAGLAGFAVLVPAMIGLGRLALVEPRGQLLLMFLIVLIAAADVGAYFGGRAFGRHKLAPLVSPGKTWEGFVAGMLGAGAAAWAGALIFGQPVLPWLAVVLPVALVSVVGDLVESMFKRHAGLKDSGGLLPGHGGVLDRIDGFTAAAPTFLLGLQLIGVAT